MSRTFAYCRVSTSEQTTENQIIAIQGAGYHVEPHRVVSETISGKVRAKERPEWCRLIDRLESGDELIVLKLDRLGRDNIDVQQTISMLVERGICVRCLDLPVRDLSSSEGRLMLQMFSAFAEFERNRIAERTREGIERAKTEGKKLGRPEATSTTKKVQECKAGGMSQQEAANHLKMGIATIKRHWNKNI
ncbi:recombinase family protein [Klebsiella sp. HSTU-Sny5]|uniref:recombinase family protein n=1 Tax=Klebsiella TaxID=570 RepID=UPI000C75E381|nr:MULTISPECIES: recombinase family protein [Klebsiella]MCJ1877168.1 recombinase family protein [Klebsiella sp. HSTU-Sny5]